VHVPNEPGGHGATTAQTAASVAASARTCLPRPGIASCTHVRPPVLVWNNAGPKAQPSLAPANRISVKPCPPECAIGDATVPALAHLAPLLVVESTVVHFLIPVGHGA
jgi:hypothetical protein